MGDTWAVMERLFPALQMQNHGRLIFGTHCAAFLQNTLPNRVNAKATVIRIAESALWLHRPCLNCIGHDWFGPTNSVGSRGEEGP